MVTIMNAPRGVHRVIACLCLCIAAATARAETDAATTRPFRIPAQSLESGLLEFAKQSGTRMFYDSQLTEGLHTSGVEGNYAPKDALARLLSGTGLATRQTETGAVSIERADPMKDLMAEARQPLRLAEAPDKPQAPAKKAEEGPTELPEITVTGEPLGDTGYNALDASTATKTDTPIMETPVSIQVVPQSVLRDQQVINLDDALKNVSGVRRFEAGANGVDEAFVVRGFKIDNVYLDGLRLPGGGQVGRLEFANIERIEVVKGPVGVLFGRIDPGGLINIVTKRPELTPSYQVQQQFGSFDTYRTTAGATGPVPGLEDLAYRLDFAYEQADSFIDFVDSERFFVAPVLTWNISEATRATLKLQYLHNEQVPINPIFPFGDKPPDIRRSTFTGRPPGFPDPDFVTSDSFIFGLHWSHDFNENWQVRQAYNGYLVDSTNQSTFCCGGFIGDGVHGRDSFLGLDRPTTTHSLTTDLLGNFETLGSKHKLLLGYEYYDSTRDNQIIGASGASNPSNFVDIFNPVPDPNPLIFDSAFSFNQFQRWHGVYVQDQIELPYHVYLMLGGRFDAAAGGSGFSTEGFKAKARVDQNQFSPRAGLLWQITPQWAAYGSYAESFGAENLGAADRNGNPLDPEESEQWEVGMKAELLDGRFTGTLSYFDLTRTNIRTADPDPFFAAQGFSVATGEVRHQGVELDVAGEILPGWNIIGNYAFLDSEIIDDNNLAIVGNRFQGTPRHIGNLFTTYELQTGPLKGLKLGGGGRAVDSFTADNAETFTVPGYITANLLTAYEWKVGENQKVVAQLNVENLFDKNFVDFTTSGFKDFFFAPPRTFLGAIRVEF